jgi:hypothetical protein
VEILWVACSAIMESGCVNQSGGSQVEGADTKGQNWLCYKIARFCGELK